MHDKTIDLLFKNLYFISIGDNMDAKPIKLPKEFQLDKNILDYAIDRYRQCIYYLLEDGIYKGCHGHKDGYTYDKVRRIVRSTRVKGVAFDHVNDYLFYYNSKRIYVLNPRTNVRVSFYLTAKTILKMHFIQKNRFFYY